MKQIGLFEMRRLEALSNTIFGVAMTLLAYDLPKAHGFAKAPSWIDLVNAYAQPLIALMISFIVAGMFWFSHHRRLAVAPEGSRGEVFLNLIFPQQRTLLVRVATSEKCQDRKSQFMAQVSEQRLSDPHNTILRRRDPSQGG